MKVVILAGGRGTRLAEETAVVPKPMVEIGGRPILWHIMKHYAHHGFKDFVVALGYKGEIIKHYFLDYRLLSSSRLTIQLVDGRVEAAEDEQRDDWTLTLAETGLETNTGGRVRRLRSLLSGETFMVTYGDGVSNLDVRALLAFHRAQGRLATITAVRPPARYGGILFDGDLVRQFTEKPQSGEGWINGGFMVLEPRIFDYLDDDRTSLEARMLERLAEEGQLAAYRHDGFWQCMDTVRDKVLLEKLWQNGQAPWKVWEP